MLHFENDLIHIEEIENNYFVLTHKPKVPSSEELHDCLDYIKHIHTQREEAILVHDLRLGANYFPSAHRIAIGNWIKNNNNLLARGAATAFVVKSMMHKILLQAIFMIQPMPMPNSIFSNRGDAEKWLEKQKEQVAI